MFCYRGGYACLKGLHNVALESFAVDTNVRIFFLRCCSVLDGTFYMFLLFCFKEICKALNTVIIFIC